MLSADTAGIIRRADEIVKIFGTRDPRMIAEGLGITVFEYPFKKQKGAYKIIMRNRYVFLKSGLDPVTARIVLWHEIGHDQFHRDEAERAGAFREFNLFDMKQNRMEYEANIFASQGSLADEDVLSCIESGYDIYQIAQALSSDINLVVLKVDTLIRKGYRLRRMEHRNDFLKS